MVKTIIKEIRATNEDRVAIGKFTIENLNLVDLRKEHIDSISKDIFDARCSAQLLCSAKTILEFLADITKEVKREDSHLEYIPTQLVSEYIRSLGFDGFIFDSSLCSGTNYVLFKNSYTFVEYQIMNITSSKPNFNKWQIYKGLIIFTIGFFSILEVFLYF